MSLLLNRKVDLSLRQLWALIKAPAQLFTLSAILVNAGNYAYNIWLGRRLSPELFAEAVLLITILLVLSFLATGIQLTVAKYSAELDLEERNNSVDYICRAALLIGSAIGLCIFLFAKQLSLLFAMNKPSVFYPLAVCVPFYLLLSVSRGKAQGERQYLKLATTYQLEMLSRFAITIFTIGWLNLPASQSISLAIAGSIILSSGVNPRLPKLRRPIILSKTLKKRIVIFFMYIGLYECLQIVCSNADLLMVKHYFASDAAGQYAAMALIGRIVFFVTWMIVMLLLPEVVNARKTGANHKQLFLKYIFGITVLVSVLVCGCYLFPNQIVNLMFGQAYAQIAPLLGPYALATGCFALANVFVYYALSLDHYKAVWVALAFGGLQLISFTVWHNSLKEIVFIQLICMSFLLLIQIVMLLKSWSYKMAV